MLLRVEVHGLGLVAGDVGSGLALLDGKEGAVEILELAFTNILKIFRVLRFGNIHITITFSITRFAIANTTSWIDLMLKKVLRKIVFNGK